MAFSSYVCQRQHGAPAQLTLNRKVEMLSISELVMVVVSREIGHRLVDRKIERLVGRASRNGDSERKALSFSASFPAALLPISERLREINGSRTAPIQAKRRIGNFVKQVQIFHGRVVQPVGRANTGLARSAKD